MNTFYGGLNDESKSEIDLASGGAFTENEVSRAWELLDNIRVNHEAWGINEGGGGGVEIDYDCIKTYLKIGRVDKLSEDFYLDPDIVLQVVQRYAKFL